jgi:hypothetical protein
MEVMKRDKLDALRRAKHSAAFEQVAAGRMGALQRAMQVAGLKDTSGFEDLLLANNPNNDTAIFTEHDQRWSFHRGQYNPSATSGVHQTFTPFNETPAFEGVGHRITSK